MRWMFLLLLAAVLGIGSSLAQPPGVQPPVVVKWPLDEITIANGSKFSGLILEETATDLHFQTIRRPPGKPTFTLTSRFSRADVISIHRLSDADRILLKQRLAELDTDSSGERQRMESLVLSPSIWLGRDGAARRYESDFFVLISDAPEEVVRRAAVRLEQLYTAFSRFLPPTVVDGRRTIILLAPDLNEYKALLAPIGQSDLLNPAVFDPRTNQVICGSELRRLGDELQSAKLHHSQQLATLDRYEEAVRKLYRKPELDRYLEPIVRERKRVWVADRANGAKFDAATARLFAVLYHEAFHAYASTFVYPPLMAADVTAGKGVGGMPRWLDEGLAQVFESSVVEAGELRADHPDLVRLNRVKDQVRGKAGLVPLADLIISGRDTFLAHHADQRAGSDRAYLTSWALAYYLTFHEQIIGSTRFLQYLKAINSGGDPREAFVKLVGMEVPEFEKKWHAALLRLQPSGIFGK